MWKSAPAKEKKSGRIKVLQCEKELKGSNMSENARKRIEKRRGNKTEIKKRRERRREEVSRIYKRRSCRVRSNMHTDFDKGCLPIMT